MSKRISQLNRHKIATRISAELFNTVGGFKVARRQLARIVGQLATNAVDAITDTPSMSRKLTAKERYMYRRSVLGGIKRLMYFRSGSVDLNVSISYKALVKLIEQTISAYHAVIRNELAEGGIVYLPNICYITPSKFKVGKGVNPFTGKPRVPHVTPTLSIKPAHSLRKAMRKQWFAKEGLNHAV